MTQQMDELSINGDLILNELKHMRLGIDKLDKRMEKAESNMSVAIAQSNRIDAIALNIMSIEHKVESQDRDIKAIANFQASCPRDNFDKGLDTISGHEKRNQEPMGSYWDSGNSNYSVRLLESGYKMRYKLAHLCFGLSSLFLGLGKMIRSGPMIVCDCLTLPGWFILDCHLIEQAPPEEWIEGF